MGVATQVVASAHMPMRAPLRPARASVAAAVATGIGVATLIRLSPSAWSVVAALATVVLVWVAAIDLESRLLPDKIVIPTTMLVLVLGAALEPDRAVERLVASVCAFAFLLVAVVVRPGGLGMGDAKLALLLGALLGVGVLAALVVGFGLVGLVGLALVARHGRAALKRQLPLGPFLAGAAILVLILHG